MTRVNYINSYVARGYVSEMRRENRIGVWDLFGGDRCGFETGIGGGGGNGLGVLRIQEEKWGGVERV